MRQWHIPTHLMCREHLLGEHLEHHMFVTHINMGKKLGRFLTNKLIQVSTLKSRHAELVQEMKNRGYNHNDSTDTIFDNINYDGPDGEIDEVENCVELWNRCYACQTRMKQNNFDLGG